MAVRTRAELATDISTYINDNTSEDITALDVRTVLTNIVDSLATITEGPPIGTVEAFAGAAAPTGWLLCDGSVVAQAAYPDLFTVCGTTYNTGGEGAGNFRLPNLGTGKGPVGVGGAYTLGAAGGATTHSHTVNSHDHGGATGSGTANVGDHANHTHSVDPAATDSGTPLSTSNQTFYDLVTSPGSNPISLRLGSDAHYHSTNIGPTTSGNESATQTHTDSGHTHTVSGSTPGTDSISGMDPYLVLSFIIRAL